LRLHWKRSSAVRVHNQRAEFHFSRYVRVVSNQCLHHDLGRRWGGVRCGDEDTPRRNMNGIRDYNSHVAINTRSAVPAAAWLLGTIDADRENIGLSKLQLRCEVELKACVGIGMNPKLLAVQIHSGV